METTISNCHKYIYIPEVQKLAFHIPHLQIIGTNQCGDSRRTEFKRRKSFQDVVCRHDYAERVVDICPHKLRPECYGVNISVSIEGIVLEHFSELPHTEINPSTKSCQLHAVFHYFLSDDIKKYASTTTSHSKHLI